MTTISFTKYQGTGNDFIMIDDRESTFDIHNNSLVAALCHRRFGVGADGLIAIRKGLTENSNFHMVYFNSDGKQSTMCGNGGRCSVHFAHSLGLLTNRNASSMFSFTAADGEHETAFDNADAPVSIKMVPVHSVKTYDSDTYFLNTGSPHHCHFVQSDIEQYDVKNLGYKIRHDQRYAHHNGTNVNFISVLGNDQIFVRTFERGVEDETYSCGTGSIAAAMVYVLKFKSESTEQVHNIQIQTLGGFLTVRFKAQITKESVSFTDVFLIGPASPVFTGSFKPC